MIDGIASSPFSAVGLPPLKVEEKTNNTEQVIAYSREKYATDRETVEEKIMRWHESYGDDERSKNQVSKQNLSKLSPSQAESLSQSLSGNVGSANNNIKEQVKSKVESKGSISKAKKASNLEEGYEAVCSECGEMTKTVFEPDGVRPVYCRNCLSKKREEKRQEIELRKQAKEIERKKLVEANFTEPTNQSELPTMSLNDLTKVKPVDFRGRVIKKHFESSEARSSEVSEVRSNEPSEALSLEKTFINKEKAPITKPEIETKKNIPSYLPAIEKDLPEGEEIDIFS